MSIKVLLKIMNIQAEQHLFRNGHITNKRRSIKDASIALKVYKYYFYHL